MASVSLTASGITFADYQTVSSSTTDAELFDHYEEGDWTPGITNATSFTTQTGIYTRAGNIVSVHFDMNCAFDASGTTGQSLTGAPFTSSNDPAVYAMGILFPVIGWNADNINIAIQQTPNATTWAMYSVAKNTSTNYTGINSSMFGTTVLAEFSSVYKAA